MPDPTRLARPGIHAFRRADHLQLDRGGGESRPAHRASADHRDHVPAASLLDFSYEESERNWARSLSEIQAAGQAASRECIYVAEDPGGQVVGLAMGGPERTGHPLYTGEIYVLYLLPAFQRQGLGRRLVRAVAHHLASHHMRGLLIRVLRANAPARAFYESLGGQLVLQEQIEEDGVVLDQVAYGWPDLNDL